MALHKLERRSAALHLGAAAAPTDTGDITGNPAAPDPARPGLSYLELGEIALNYNKSDPAIFFRLDDDSVAKFSPTAGLKIVDTVNDLPLPTATLAPPPAGASYLVRFAADGATPLGRIATWDPSLPAPAGAPAAQPPGDWRWTQGQAFIKPKASGADWLETGRTAVVLEPGDLQVTTEKGSEAIQIWNGTAWESVFDVQELLYRAAAMRVVERRAQLPVPTLASRLADGELAFVRLNDQGDVAPHLAIWRESTPASGTVPARGDWVSLDPLFRGVATRWSDLPIPVLGGAIPEGWAFYVRLDKFGRQLNRLVIWHETAAEDLATNTEQQGVWESIDQSVFMKRLRSSPDQRADVVAGDLQITLEKDHEEIKIWDSAGTGQWHEIYSADQVKAWIAALNLFEGTVTEIGPKIPGAIDFDQLPDFEDVSPAALAANAELAAHYWTFVGTPGYTIAGADPQGGGITAISGVPAALRPLPAQGLPFDGILHVRPRGPAPHGAGARVHVQIDATGAVTSTIVSAGHDYKVGETLHITDRGNLFDFQVTVGSVGASTGDPNGLGRDLAGAKLNPGDWLQAVNQGTAAAPDMHWVAIGGDLLAKSRADLLYGLQPWSVGSWEKGALVVYEQKIWRSTRPILPADGTPGFLVVSIPVAIAPPFDTWRGTMDVSFPPVGSVASGQVIELTGDCTTMTGGTEPFSGATLPAGSRLLWTGDVKNDGRSVDGRLFSQGWLLIPPAAALPTAPATAKIPSATWRQVDLAAGVVTVDIDQNRPQQPNAGDLILVLTSAANQNKPALQVWDDGAKAWVVVGGSGGLALKLTGGDLIYPKQITMVGFPTTNLAALPKEQQPRVAGDVLWVKGGGATNRPRIVAVSYDGSTWTRVPPHYYQATDIYGGGLPAKADYPGQIGVFFEGGESKVVAISDDSSDWRSFCPLRSKHWTYQIAQSWHSTFTLTTEQAANGLGGVRGIVNHDPKLGEKIATDQPARLTWTARMSAAADFYEDRAQYVGVVVRFCDAGGANPGGTVIAHQEIRDAYTLRDRAWSGIVLLDDGSTGFSTRSSVELTFQKSFNHGGSWQPITFDAVLELPINIR